MTLAGIDSVSRRERGVVDHLAVRLGDLGLEYTEDGAGNVINGTAGNIVARLPGTVPGPTLLFCTHMDTVEPGNGVKPRVEGHAIRSGGDTILGADDKAGMAAVLEAVTVLKEQGLPHPKLELVFTVSEEIGLLGIKEIDFGRLESVMGFVLDSDGTPGKVITRAPSQDRIVATVVGRAAHAGINPEDGVNAIQAAARAIADLPLGRIDEETTANIGVIRGGQATNIIPERVHLEGETRSLDNNKRRSLTEHICRMMTERVEAAGAQIKIEVEQIYSSFALEPDTRPVRMALKAAANVGLVAAIEQTGGGSDANVLNEHGIPTVNISTGMRKVHSTEEYLLIEDLVNTTRHVLEIIRLAGLNKE
jgi:tripeptide aminopeptidase